MGYHDFRITTGGLAVYPRILQDNAKVDADDRTLSSGDSKVDELLGGGLTRGTNLLITVRRNGHSQFFAANTLTQPSNGVRQSCFPVR